MEIINGVEHYDEPQYPDIDWTEWYEQHCDVCKWQDVCDVPLEMAINGWSSDLVTESDTVKCIAFEEICQSG